MATPSSDRSLDREIDAYNAMKEDLQKSSLRKWVVFHNRQLQGTYGDFDSAAYAAVEKFGRGPYLIRQVGEEDMVLPASVVYAVSHDAG
ncbi:MAG: hypothetical protein WDO70_01905 [Alphaproteobacteria bacterium]